MNKKYLSRTMTKRQIVVTSIIAVIVMIILGFGAMGMLSGMKEEPKKFDAPKNIRAVQVKTVEYDTLTAAVRETGRIVSREIVDLISEVPGKILPAEVPLKKGQDFKKGQLLVKIYNEDAAYNLKAMKSMFLHSLANILSDYKVDFPERYEVWRNFLDNIDLEEDLPPLPKVTGGKEKVYLAGRNILTEYYNIKSEEIRLKKYNIYAPFDGAYTAVNLEAGSVTNIGGRIASMIRTDKLEMEVPLDITEASMIYEAMKVKVVSKDANSSWQGTVSRKSTFVDPATQSINVYVSLNPSKDNPMYKGMYLEAVFNKMQFKNVIEIPRSAVYNFNEVFIVEKGKLQKRVINILKTNEKTYLINGVEEGAKLVSEPLVNAAENMEVQIFNQ